ncbi:hypothetical protein [Clostridium sp.]|uniref:hypothetical protein n=1 Tax=Clostridium sp. TaxID=1506 RepID=UPI0025B9098C|nr:hypothetical protein [Clostridium sp.]
MNENIDLTKILKDCPIGYKLYTPLIGEVEVVEIYDNTEKGKGVIHVKDNNYYELFFTKKGFYFPDANGECLLFPSKDQRDWSKFSAPWYKKEKFDPKTLKPFDKVLVKEWGKWTIDFFPYFNLVSEDPYYCIGHFADIIIPYNDDTKHLVGAIDVAPEYYRYWEE